ncbi:hypothetical protein ACFS4T_25500 [Pseudomonas lini]
MLLLFWLFLIFFHAFPTVLRGGFVGVDIFFVISGYLISKVILTTLYQGTFTIADFLFSSHTSNTPCTCDRISQLLGIRLEYDAG